MTRPVNLALCQFVLRPVADFAAFTAQVTRHLDAARGADLVLLPELFTLSLFTTLPDWQQRELAEVVLIDRYTAALCAWFEREARVRGQYLVAGSHLEQHDGGWFNVSRVYGPDGVVHAHAKTHLFPAETLWNGAEGTRMEAFDLPFGRCGINICYEAEIPECATSLAEQGAELILCPSFTFAEAGFWRVRHCAQARCIENQLYFAHCATGGELPAGPLPNGWTRSAVLSPCDAPWPAPNGVVAEAETQIETVLHTTVDLDLLAENRARGAAPTFRDRRRRLDRYRAWPSPLNTPA